MPASVTCFSPHCPFSDHFEPFFVPSTSQGFSAKVLGPLHMLFSLLGFSLLCSKTGQLQLILQVLAFLAIILNFVLHTLGGSQTAPTKEGANKRATPYLFSKHCFLCRSFHNLKLFWCICLLVLVCSPLSFKKECHLFVYQFAPGPRKVNRMFINFLMKKVNKKGKKKASHPSPS